MSSRLSAPLIAAAATSAVLVLTSCGAGAAGSGDSGGDSVIRVASHMPPMTDVVELAGEVAAEDGWEIELVRVNDNVQYNRLLADGEVDANFAQHEPYMQKFNAEHDADLTAIAPIYDAKVGFYSREYEDVSEIPDGAKVAIPNDASNQGRALAMLDEQGLITLREGVGFEGRVADVVENPHAFDWVRVDLLNLASAYEEDDVALVYNYPTYISKVGLTPEDALFLEETVDQRFSISLVARSQDEESEKIQALREAMTSEQVRNFLTEEHAATLRPAF